MKYYYTAAVTYRNICTICTGLLQFVIFTVSDAVKLNDHWWVLTLCHHLDKCTVFSFSSFLRTLGVTATKMDLGHKFQDLEETGDTLVALINSAQTETLREIKHEHHVLFDQHIETKKLLTQILRGK